MAQKLRLMIGTFTHWAHVISVCVLQAEIISYTELKFCMCVITQKLFLGSVFICHKQILHFFPLFSTVAPCSIIYVDNITYSPYQWSCGLTLASEAAWLLVSRVRISLRGWTFVSCFWCVMEVAASATNRLFIQRKPTGCVCVYVCNCR